MRTLFKALTSLTTANFMQNTTTTCNATKTSISTLTTTTDLCHAIRRPRTRSEQRQPRCRVLDNLGHKERRYTVSPYQPPSNTSRQEDLGPNSLRMVPLREILNIQNGIPTLSYRDRFQLAVHAASSVFQLYRTPWLPNAPTTDNIAFTTSDEHPHYGPAFILAARNSSSSSIPTNNTTTTTFPPVIRNPTLLALGILLIEILNGQTTETLRTPEEEAAYRSGSPAGLVSGYMTARRLLADVYKLSANYGSAVQRCIDGEFPRQKLDLEDEDFGQEVYSGVAALLEEDCGYV
ncbi:hypothetical protein QBC34DRAFT_384992 [Podospora aff. communis PSN243]|uniref:DUF7580 domain-containing protein n=1 Tax=Podospora aff. communis PSN243 TaxID=3040156 RepID=A0AAV9G860_9PEZI|nr:hypothetical protein QBC34DRAFT_384992 [Podospora aff. communis PSN243]